MESRPPPIVTDIRLVSPEGVVMVGQRWRAAEEDSSKTSTTRPAQQLHILCLHGSMDNCRSFYYLAPALAQIPGVDLVALDLPGHGKASHKSRVDSRNMAEFVYDVAEALRSLGWTKDVILIGHSMGGNIGVVYSAAFPEQISNLIIIDGFLPYLPDKEFQKLVRLHIQQKLSLNLKPPKPKFYPSIEKAMDVRCRSAEVVSSTMWISRAAARELVEWSTISIHDDEKGPGFHFIHDPHLRILSFHIMSVQHVEALYAAVGKPVRVAFIRAQNGWPIDKTMEQRFVSILNPDLHVTLKGSHHLHADPDTAEACAQVVLDFLNLRH